MRQLHVVAVTSDGKSLLLAGAAKGARATHKLAVDQKLHAALAGELYADALDGEEPRQESALTPREMQARLRAGETVEQVARAAGVAPERVERYAGPVESERHQVLDAARSIVMDRPRWGASARTLGDSVVANLAYVAGLDPDSLAWSTRRRQDGCWILRLDFSARGRRRAAEWEWEPAERAVTAIDPTATSLGYIEPRSRARARAGASASRRTAKRSTGRRSARKAATRKVSTRKVSTRKVSTRKAATKKATKKATGRKAAPARKATSRTTTTRKTAQRKIGKRATGGKAVARRTARTTGRKATGGRRTSGRR